MPADQILEPVTHAWQTHPHHSPIPPTLVSSVTSQQRPGRIVPEVSTSHAPLPYSTAKHRLTLSVSSIRKIHLPFPLRATR